MIRLLGWLIRCFLSFVLVLVGVVFFGPYLVQVVDKWAGRVEEYPSFSERLESMGRVWDLLEEKELGEIGFQDLMSMNGSEESSPDSIDSPEQLRVLGHGLTPAEIETLGGIYRDILDGEQSSSLEEAAPLADAESGIRPSGGLTPSGGL